MHFFGLFIFKALMFQYKSITHGSLRGGVEDYFSTTQTQNTLQDIDKPRRAKYISTDQMMFTNRVCFHLCTRISQISRTSLRTSRHKTHTYHFMKMATSKARQKKSRDCVKIVTRRAYVWCKDKHFARKKLAFLFVRNELFNHTLNKHQHER